MRITGGILRGLSLKSPRNSGIRPTTDKVRSAIFSKLYDKTVNAFVLDLFAGTGAFGIEAISRGAKHVVFIDKHINLLKTNLNLISMNNYQIIRGDIYKCLGIIKLNFDIIFIDPPYGKINSKTLLEYILANQLIAKNGILIYEESIRTKFEIVSDFRLLDEKKYGDTKIYYLEII